MNYQIQSPLVFLKSQSIVIKMNNSHLIIKNDLEFLENYKARGGCYEKTELSYIS